MRALTMIGGLALLTLFTFYAFIAVLLGEGLAGESGTISERREAAMYAVIVVILWPARVLQSMVPGWRSVPAEAAAFALFSSVVWGLVLYALGRLARTLFTRWATRPLLR